MLKYTYCLGYFLKDGSPEKRLFEHQQEMLEKHTEKLQEHTEKGGGGGGGAGVYNAPSPYGGGEERTMVVNLTRVTERFLSALLSVMTGGVVRIDEGGVGGGGGQVQGGVVHK